MCISRCHIIFWGDKTIKFGVNVIQRHSSKRQRYESSSEKTWSTVRWLQRYDELRQRIEILCIITKNVVCCRELYMCLRDIQLFWCWIVYIFLFWRNVLMKHSDVELWTAEMSFQYNVRLMNDVRRWIFCCRMNSFVKTFIWFTKWDVIASTIVDGTFFVICPSSSSFSTCSTNIHHLFTRLDDEDFRIKTAAETLNRNWQHFESTPRNCVTVWTVIVD